MTRWTITTKRLLGFGLLTSKFAAALQLSQNHSGNVLTYPSPGEVTAGAVGQQMANLGSEVTRRNLNVQPTIKIEAGYRFNVRVNRDIAFDPILIGRFVQPSKC